MNMPSSATTNTILVVDDETDLGELLTTFLDDEGYSVVAAANGQEALDAIRKQRPALVLLDLMMPVMNGWEFLEVVGDNPDLSNLPVILISASREAEKTAQQPVVKGLIPKPFDLNVILSWVERYAQSMH